MVDEVLAASVTPVDSRRAFAVDDTRALAIDGHCHEKEEKSSTDDSNMFDSEDERESLKQQ